MLVRGLVRFAEHGFGIALAARSHLASAPSRGEDNARRNEGQRLGGPWRFPVARAIRHRENDPTKLSGNDIVRLRWSLESRCSKQKVLVARENVSLNASMCYVFEDIHFFLSDLL